MSGSPPDFAWPIAGSVSQPFGHNGHPGIDLVGPNGGAVGATAGGTVTSAGWNAGGYGNMVDLDHGGGWSSKVAHLSRVDVRVGQQVGKGQLLGAEGTTGNSTGPHVHFEIRRDGTLQDPAALIGGNPQQSAGVLEAARSAVGSVVESSPANAILGASQTTADALKFAAQLGDPATWRRVLSVIVGGFLIGAGVLIVTKEQWMPAAKVAAEVAIKAAAA
jgi:murein DD-endopeptidase MepM/ murein hydrolase activator NlpD